MSNGSGFVGTALWQANFSDAAGWNSGPQYYSTIRFTDLHRWVTELDDFADDPTASNESTLEKVQMAWLDEYRSR